MDRWALGNVLVTQQDRAPPAPHPSLATPWPLCAGHALCCVAGLDLASWARGRPSAPSCPLWGTFLRLPLFTIEGAGGWESRWLTSLSRDAEEGAGSGFLRPFWKAPEEGGGQEEVPAWSGVQAPPGSEEAASPRETLRATVATALVEGKGVSWPRPWPGVKSALDEEGPRTAAWDVPLPP